MGAGVLMQDREFVDISLIICWWNQQLFNKLSTFYQYQQIINKFFLLHQGNVNSAINYLLILNQKSTLFQHKVFNQHSINPLKDFLTMTKSWSTFDRQLINDHSTNYQQSLNSYSTVDQNWINTRSKFYQYLTNDYKRSVFCYWLDIDDIKIICWLTIDIVLIKCWFTALHCPPGRGYPARHGGRRHARARACMPVPP